MRKKEHWFINVLCLYAIAMVLFFLDMLVMAIWGSGITTIPVVKEAIAFLLL